MQEEPELLWLAVLVVGSEFTIVLSRFIFEYEQAFQGDLVRFWYSALYLFASAYALMHEGHVRVDVLYTGFTERKKAWTNSMGSLVLGIPLCLIVIFLFMFCPSFFWMLDSSSPPLFLSFFEKSLLKKSSVT